MSDTKAEHSELRTTQMQNWLANFQAGDPTAADRLLRKTSARLERLARKMFSRYGNVARWVDVDDVLQNATVRLLQSLKKLTPGSMRDFYGLAAEHFRRELIDLARHYYGAHGVGANHASQAGAPSSANFDPADQSDSSAELEDMCRFHEEVEKLPAELREVVSLIYYHGCEQAEIAKLLNVSVRTVQRRWQSAMIRLHGTLRETEPAPGGS